MAEERDEILQREIDDLEEKTKVLAQKMQELVGVDCNFGACVFDPAMTDIEAKIDEVQKRKRALERIMSDVEACEREV